MKTDLSSFMEDDIVISEEQFQEEIVNIARVSKTVKGGKRMKFRVLMVVGNGSGLVGIGLGKSDQIPNAITKAINAAKRELIRVPVRGTTIPYDVRGKLGSTTVYLAPAVPGTGLIAGGSVRKILEKVGVKDVIAKIYGSHNAINTARATISALSQLMDPVDLAKLRDLSLKQLFGI